ncbi:MAG: UvrD-helicase domain-containing protein, partial [Archangium sp.]|nr:UvrD-helicase domain-containing protein [Archangium sp.]
MTRPGDVAVRQRLLEQLDTSFVVEAAAGTGKTTVLVARVVALVQSGKALLERIIAVTFTEKAAGELKLRLRDALERARQTAPEPAATHLRHALEQLEAARIGTIHGVCADLLREYPVEAGVDPMFDVAAEDEAAGLFSRAFERWFEHAVATPPEGVRRLLRRRPQRSDDEAPRELLRSAAWRLAEHRDFDGAWERPGFAREVAIDAVVQRLERLSLHARAYTGDGSSRSSPFIDNLRSVARFVDDLRHRESVRERDFDDLEAGLTVLARDWNWERAPWKRDTFNGRTTDDVARERDDTFAELKAFKNASEGDLAACLQTELRPILDAYEDEKARAGTLDFVDLLHKTRTLLRTQRAVRAALRRRFSHVFVDEFQDVDPMQVELVLLLASSTPDIDDAFSTTIAPGALFVVGDPKQSIYRFRRADIALYERVKQHLVRQGAQVEYLSTSFRSTPGIQAAVNAAFAQIMTPETPGQAQYVPLEPHRPRTPSQPSLVAL